MTFTNNIDDDEISSYINKLLMMAMGFFVFTTIIGIINVLDIADKFLYAKRGILLFHLHAGTIAWISTGIVTAMIWAFSNNREITTEYKAKVTLFYKYWQAVIPTYAVIILIAFQFDLHFLLPLFAILTVGGFIWASYFAFSEKDNVEVFGVPHLSFVIGLAIAGYAGIIGTLLGIQHIVGEAFLPGDGVGGHASGMEIGYVFVVMTGLVELFLKGGDLKPLNNLGIAQPVLLMTSALASSFGLLFNIGPLIQLSLPLEIIGVLIFFIRLGPELIKIEHLKDKGNRFFIVVPIFLLLAVVLFIYLLVNYFIPENLNDPYIGNLLLSLNHSELVGAASGGLFGMITNYSRDNRDGNLEWADDVGFGLMYIGLIGFLLGFLMEFALHSAILMGTGILILITAFFIRLSNS